jgi:hypothetical protein
VQNPVSMKKRNICPLLFAVFTLASGLYPVYVLQIDAPRKSAVVFVRSVKPGDRFSLTYRHSVELCLIEDYFSIDGEGRLVLDETDFASSNTGLPSMLIGEERFTRREKSFRISNMKRILPAIDVWVDRRYDNILEFGGQKVRLAGFAGNTLLRFNIRNVIGFEYIYLKMSSILLDGHDEDMT